MTDIKKDFMPTYQKEKAFELQLQEDLKTLVEKAEGLEGVSRAAIISAKDIIVDEKVRWKCLFPICFGVGSSPCCPPNTPPVDECERIIHSFRYAVVFQLDVPVEIFARSSEHFGPMPDDIDPAWQGAIDEGSQPWIDNNDACNRIEEIANSMGYRQAVSFQGGPCLGLITRKCGDLFGKSNCAVNNGQTCRNFLKVRPAMEAMAIDVIGTILPLGWDMVYIGGGLNTAADIPCASTAGLLLVA